MSYSAEISNAVGTNQKVLTSILSIEFARSFGNVGELRITVDDKGLSPTLYQRNWRIKLWRHLPGRAPIFVGNTIWFLRKVTWDVLGKTLSFHAQDALGLLRDRIVAYTPQTTFADKTIEELGAIPFADDSILAYLRENFGEDCVDTERDASSYFFIPEDQSRGAQVNKEAAWQDILGVLQDVARSSTQLGVPIVYDVSMNQDGKFVFDLWTGRRGTDRTIGSAQPHVFGVQQNNVSELNLTWDYSEEKNVAYVGGYDTGASRVVATVVYDDRVRLDPFSRAEVFLDGGDSDVLSVLQHIGRTALEGFRPILRAEATAVETNESIYGVHYDYADTVSLIAGGIELPVDITAVGGNYVDGKDTINLRLTGQRQI